MEFILSFNCVKKLFWSESFLLLSLLFVSLIIIFWSIQDRRISGLRAKKEIQTLILPQSRILGQEDYNLFGKPRENVVKDLQAEHYDLLIDLTTRPVLSLRYLAMFTNADFKVGLNLGEGIHDMLISLPDFTPEQGEEADIEASWLYHQLMSYLTTIKSND